MSQDSAIEPTVDETINAVEKSTTNDHNIEQDELDDLFGDDDDEDKNESNNEESGNENETGYGHSRGRSEMDEEEAMYTRKFYGEDVDYMSDKDDGNHQFKEEDVQLVRHMVPYKTISKNENNNSVEDKNIYYAKVPPFLMIDPVPFDPPNFEAKVKERISKTSEEDQLDDRLIDENTVRWRYSRDANQRVFKESNAQVVKWSDGSYSLKLGEEYTDIIVNSTDNTFLAVSHDQQELMQCTDGGEISKTIMFIPTSTNSKIHQRLSKAVSRRNTRGHAGPGTYLMGLDPELEKKELETKLNQIMRDRRRRQREENELLDAGEVPTDSFGRRSTPKPVRGYSRSDNEDHYENDDFLVDDDEDENEYADEEEEEEEDILDNGDDEEEERRNAQRLKNMKRSNAEFGEDESEDDDSNKKRKAAVISDDDEE